MTTYSFILYIAGTLPNSVQAVSNFEAICAARRLKDWRVQVVDVLRDPMRGLKNGILVTPTLVKLEPEPKQIVIGNLSDDSAVLNAIGWISRTNPMKLEVDNE